MISRDAIFVVFEGADVVGKTEQVNLLTARFAAEGIPVARESFPRYETPVGLALGRHLRGEIRVCEDDNELFENSISHKCASEDALFFEALNCLDKMAGAADVLENLTKGTSVISSRWWQTSVIYGKDAEISGEYLRRVYSRMPQADVNFLIDCSAATCLARRTTQRDRYERDLAKQERVRVAYRRMWSLPCAAGEGWNRILDGERTAEEVHALVWETLIGHSKMQGLLARHAPLSAEDRLERLRAIVQKPGNTLGMSEADAEEFAGLLFGLAREPT